ncbi:MAG: hypothetical protein AB7O24_25885 [Kofleriaceae bacterium]
MKDWVRRASELHHELGAIAELDARWWLIAGGVAAAEPWPPRASYVWSDAEPGADTFIGHHVPAPIDPICDAIAAAHAARAAIRELDGALPDQPLAVTVRRSGEATLVPSALDTAAFAIGSHRLIAKLADDVADEAVLARELATLCAGANPPATTKGHPFVTISIGDEPLETARHGHRRGWIDDAGPWLGVSRAGGMAIVSTCHIVVDGYGHSSLAAMIADHRARLIERAPRGSIAHAPPLDRVAGAVPLGIAWRELTAPGPRALPLSYALGQALHRAAGNPGARFSPTIQVPVAPGAGDDPDRRRRRVVPAVVSVRFDHGHAEPYEVFEARSRDALAREAAGTGLCARLMTAARAAPLSLSYKRKGFSAARPRWLDSVAEVIGGRACVSRMRLDRAVPPSCAVSSPARLASSSDRLGGCVITVIDDGTRAAITVCGSGLAGTPLAARALLDQLLES